MKKLFKLKHEREECYPQNRSKFISKNQSLIDITKKYESIFYQESLGHPYKLKSVYVKVPEVNEVSGIFYNSHTDSDL